MAHSPQCDAVSVLAPAAMHAPAPAPAHAPAHAHAPTRLQRLLERTCPPVMLDGGFATECERLGHALQGKLWSAAVLVHHPEDVLRVHERFLVCAHADVIETASYQAARAGFEHAGVHGWEAHLLRSVELAAAARGRYEASNPSSAGRVVLASSLGPVGAVWGDGSEFTGTYGLPSDAPVVPVTAALVPGRQSLESMLAFHRERLRVLDATCVDVFAFETVPCLLEVEAICTLLAREFPHRRAWISCSCRAGDALSSGEPLAEVARVAARVADAQVVALGVNCCHPAIVEQAVRVLVDASAAIGAPHRRVLAYPNRGELWDAETQSWCSRPWTDPLAAEGTPTPEEYVQLALRWKAAGAWAIGGCCRTTPELLLQVRDALVAKA